MKKSRGAKPPPIIEGIKYTFDLKLNILNNKIKTFIDNRNELGIVLAYENILEGTELYEKYQDANRKSKYYDVNTMIHILSTLIRSGYIGSYHLEKMVDNYNWIRLKKMWNLDETYPEYSFDYWLFDIGYV